MSDEEVALPDEALETPKKKPPGPNAWRAGRKPSKDSGLAKRQGSDYVGGEVAIKADTMLEVAEANDPAYKRFSEIVGGREGLKELAAWSENPKAQKLFQLIDDGRYKTYGIKALAKRCGMTLPELCNLFREKHFLDMYLTFFASMPNIAKGVVQDAQPSTDVCPMCSGIGVVTRGKSESECPKCKGSGEVRVPGDKEARRDVFKAAGVIKDQPAVINQNVTNLSIEGVGDFEDLMRSVKTTPIVKVEKVAKKEPEAYDAEIVEE